MRRAAAVLLISLSAIGAALPAPARAENTPAPPAGFSDAQTLIDQKRYPEAVEKLRAVTAAQPTFEPAWYALALAARRGGHCTEAIPAYRRYAGLRPADAEPYFGLGLCLRDTGDRPAAIAALKQFVELEKRPAQAKWVETARSLIATLAAPAPAAPGAERGRAAYEEAQRLRDEGQIAPALRRFADAIQLDPDLMAARAAWGELLVKIHREADAAAVFRAAVDRNPQYALAWYELGFTLRETGRYAEAVDAYQRYVQLRPTDPDPHYGLGRAQEKLGRGPEALRSFETYVTMEKRPGEERWVASAKGKIAALNRSGVSRAAAVDAPAVAPAPTSRPTATPTPPTPLPLPSTWSPGSSTAPPSFSPAGRDPAPAQPR